MTYNTETHKRYCDICGADVPAWYCKSYSRDSSSRTQHICDRCSAEGAYWCAACREVHRSQADCPQLPLPEPGQEATNG